MAITLVQDLPRVTSEIYNAIIRELNMETKPDGLIAHAAGPYDGGWRIVDIWESSEAHQAFVRDHLRGARERALASLGIEPSTGEFPLQVMEVEHLIT
jgi:hypothetical protein